MILLLLFVAIVVPLVYRIVKEIVLIYYGGPQFGWNVDLKSTGKWAVVTGGGFGIGRGYALDLARRGLNVCIIGRTGSRLESVAKEIKDLGRDTMILAHDFSIVQNQETVLAEFLKPIINDVGVLVNNVGSAGNSPKNFATPFLDNPPSPIAYYRDMVTTNIDSAVIMTSLIAPGMVQRHAGAIVFLSSAVAIRPSYGVGIYGSCKSFIGFFAHALRLEVATHGVSVLTHTPSFVKTNLIPSIAHKYLPDAIAPQPEYVAHHALNCVGVLATTDACWQHAIQNSIIRSMNSWIPTPVLDWMLKMSLISLRNADDKFTGDKKEN